MLEVTSIQQFYGGSQILREVSLTAPTSACSVILGRNGVGKTTLLKCLMGVLPIKSGQIKLDGKDISKLKPYQRAAMGMAYVPQGREIFSRLTVEENLLMGLAVSKGKASRNIPSNIYEMFPVLKEMLHRRGGDLSGGQQQQLAIARALVSKPKLLILDEATSALDYESERQVCLNLADAFRDRTVFFITHRLSTIRDADEVWVVEGGEVRRRCSPAGPAPGPP